MERPCKNFLHKATHPSATTYTSGRRWSCSCTPHQKGGRREGKHLVSPSSDIYHCPLGPAPPTCLMALASCLLLASNLLLRSYQTHVLHAHSTTQRQQHSHGNSTTAHGTSTSHGTSTTYSPSATHHHTAPAHGTSTTLHKQHTVACWHRLEAVAVPDTWGRLAGHAQEGHRRACRQGQQDSV